VPLPRVFAEPERYQGRPLLVLLENYVLDVIGELAPERRQGVLAITQRVFGGAEDWRATLRSTLHLSDGLDANLLDMWARNQEIAREAGIHLHPIQFAKMVADTNFTHLIDRIEHR
jgi:hypothetical protein